MWNVPQEKKEKKKKKRRYKIIYKFPQQKCVK